MTTTTTRPTGSVRVRRWDDPPPNTPATNPHAADGSETEPPAEQTSVETAGRGRLFWWAITMTAIVYTTIAAAVWSGDANPITTLGTAATATVCSVLMITIDVKRTQ